MHIYKTMSIVRKKWISNVQISIQQLFVSKKYIVKLEKQTSKLFIQRKNIVAK